LCRVDHDGADVIGVGLERGNLLAGVVVVHPDLAVIRESVPAQQPTGTEGAPYKSSDPQTIQFLRAMKRPARTGTSVSSNVLTTCWVSYDQM
jgi:hypothetical protein